MTMTSQEIIQNMIQQVEVYATSPEQQEHHEQGQEVIFESDINGTRYCLVRCQAKPNSQINLSPREEAIAKLVAKGLPNKCIGQELDISHWTVATYLRRIFIKLGVKSRTAMVSKLLAENWLQV